MNPNSDLKDSLEKLLFKSSKNHNKLSNDNSNTFYKLPIKSKTYNTYKTNNEIVYLKDELNINTQLINLKYTHFSLCLYTIKNKNHIPFLSYILEKKTVEDNKKCFFPVFDSNISNNTLIEHLQSTFNIENLTIKGFIELQEKVFLFIEYNETSYNEDLNNFCNATIYEICNEKICDECAIDYSVISIFKNFPFLMQLKNNYNVPLDTPIVCYYATNDDLLTEQLGPMKTDDSKYYELFAYNIKKLKPLEKFKKCIVFLINSIYIFNYEKEISYESLFKNYDCIFISSNIFTEKTLKYPTARIIVNNRENIILV
tara:strand:- start:1213 stop:2154 length:942 start_codon:yes stop_codon:yes gene_type:complete